MKLSHLRIEARYQRAKLAEKFWTGLAWKLPDRLAYWATIRVLAYATTGKYGGQVVPELYAVDALERWGRDKLGHPGDAPVPA
jgi:hypothetical protein